MEKAGGGVYFCFRCVAMPERSMTAMVNRRSPLPGGAVPRFRGAAPTAQGDMIVVNVASFEGEWQLLLLPLCAGGE